MYSSRNVRFEPDTPMAAHLLLRPRGAMRVSAITIADSVVKLRNKNVLKMSTHLASCELNVSHTYLEKIVTLTELLKTRGSRYPRFKPVNFADVYEFRCSR